ncbi:MAG: response regulator [Caldilineaceae bacterium]
MAKQQLVRSAAASARPSTIALLDIMLPDINGVALLKQLKAYYPHLLVLVISSEDEEIYAPITAQAGASGYMNKCYAGTTL